MKKIGQTLSFLLLALFILPLFACGGSELSCSNYKITCELSEDTLTGTEVFTYYNSTENSVTELKFNLFANAFRENAKYSPISLQYFVNSYPNGVSYGEIAIHSVLVSNKNVEYSICGEDKNILSVPLGCEIFPGESIVVTIDYTLKLANVIARTGINNKTINLANFYPILCAYDENKGFYECIYYSSGDPFYSDCADYLVTITYDSEYVVASAGKILSSYMKEDKTVSTYKLSNGRSFNMVLSKEFESVTDNSTGVTINYYYYDDANPENSLEYAVKSIKLFSEKFGEYAYDTYSVVQTKLIQGGMEFPTIVMISDNLEEKAYGEVIVHETAHQWWQSAVGNNEIEYGFLDEGLTEYSVVIFYENFSEYGLTRENMIKSAELTYKTFCSVYEKLFGSTNTTMIRSLKEFSSEYEYVNISYIKPCIMYDYLRQTIGDNKFFAGLRKYYDEYKFKNVTPDDIVGSFERCGTDTNGFFQSFFDGKVIL